MGNRAFTCYAPELWNSLNWTLICKSPELLKSFFDSYVLKFAFNIWSAADTCWRLDRSKSIYTFQLYSHCNGSCQHKDHSGEWHYTQTRTLFKDLFLPQWNQVMFRRSTRATENMITIWTTHYPTTCLYISWNPTANLHFVVWSSMWMSCWAIVHLCSRRLYYRIMARCDLRNNLHL